MAFSETVTVLRAQRGLACKTITPARTVPYDRVKYWWHGSVEITGIAEVAELLSTLECDSSAVIIRGLPKSDLPRQESVRRINDNFEGRPVRLNCIDIDNIETPEGVSPISLEAVEYVIRMLPPEFHDVSYVAQFSSRAGLSNKIKVHLWFLFREPQDDGTMRKWAKSIGLIDPNLYQAVQAHYTARPRFKGVADPFDGGSRVKLVRKTHDYVDFSPPAALSYSGLWEGEDYEASEIVYDDDRKAIDGREGLLRGIRWKVLWKLSPKSLDDFVEKVWREFKQQAVLGPTPQSSNSYTREIVAQRCELDWEKHGEIIPALEQTLVPLNEAEQLVRKSVQDALSGNQVAIRVTPGVGKSTITAEELVLLPDIERRFIEIYAPSIAQQREWAERLEAIAEKAGKKPFIRAILGRSEDTCKKYGTAKELPKLGIPIESALCTGKLGAGKQKCEYYDNCPYQAQFGERGPGIRIYSHAHLTTPRRRNFPAPSIVVIDESFLSVAISSKSLSLYDIHAVMSGVMDSWKLDHSTKNSTFDALRALREILEAREPLLDSFRNRGVDSEVLREAAKAISTAAPFIAPGENETIADLKARADKRQRGAFITLTRLCRALATELETRRSNAHCIKYTDEGFQFCSRNKLRRVEGDEEIPSILLLDADLERENVVPFFPTIRVDSIDAVQNLRIEQISDRSFSRSWLGLKGESLNEEALAELCKQIRPRLGQRPLIVTYKALIGLLRQRLPARCKFAHFGNVRGTNAYEDCYTVFVIGRQFLGTDVIDAQARALHYDDPRPLLYGVVCHRHAVAQEVLPAVDFVDPRLQALMIAQREAETRQAVGRVRGVRSATQKKAYLFSNQPVPGFDPDRVRKFKPNKATRIYEGLNGCLPFNAKVLGTVAPWAFPGGDRQAGNWLRQPENSSGEAISNLLACPEEFGTPTLTQGRVRGSSGRNFKIVVSPAMHTYPEYSVPNLLKRTGSDIEIVVEPLPWVRVDPDDLPWDLPKGGCVQVLRDDLQATLAKWAPAAARRKRHKLTLQNLEEWKTSRPSSMCAIAKPQYAEESLLSDQRCAVVACHAIHAA